MSVTNIKTVNFGKSKTGLTGITGYTVYAANGTISQPRTTTGIYELGESGIYASEITFDDDFHGSIFWDVTTGGNTVYASEEYNATSQTSASLTALTADVQFIKQIEGGKWVLDTIQNHMVFYDDDNVTEIARFAMYDKNGIPSTSSVYRRDRIPTEA